MSDAKNTESKPKGKGKLILFIALGLLLSAGGAAGAYFALGGNHKGGHEAAAEEKKPAKKQLFTTLEPFTVNLQDPRGERFAQIGVTLQFEDPAVEVTVKDRLPAVRNAILLLISSKQMEDLLSTEGKQKLAEEIRAKTAKAIDAKEGKDGKPVDNPVRDVLFSQFIVQ